MREVEEGMTKRVYLVVTRGTGQIISEGIAALMALRSEAVRQGWTVDEVTMGENEPIRAEVSTDTDAFAVGWSGDRWERTASS